MSYAQKILNLSSGDKIQILSDKSYRRNEQDLIEANGNVMIALKDQNNKIYGEKATLSLQSGETNVVGNVRFVSAGLSIYGTEILYNFKTDHFIAKNARMISDNYIVLGEKIIRERKKKIIATNAEYTTCQDCPESWTVFGKKIHITLGEYIHISHGLIKVNGVVMMYFPYMIFPIKKDRQSGLLFPRFKMDLERGMYLGLPWFWAISPSSDLTLTPSIFGKRGKGGELQYRNIFGRRQWFEFNTMNIRDLIYLPGKKDDKTHSGTSTSRHFMEYEHHFSHGHNFHHHLYFNHMNDLDMIRDYDNYIQKKILGSQTGGGGFFNYQSSLLDLNLESHHNRNLLAGDPKSFDHGYVQIFPRFSFSTVPFNLDFKNTPLLENITLGLEGDYTIFKQNHSYEQELIRNAHRFNSTPYINWIIAGKDGMNLQTKTEWDFQNYYFPLERQQSFLKSVVKHESTLSFSLSKIFKLAYKKKIPVEYLSLKESKKEKSYKKEMLGYLPSLKTLDSKNHVIINHHSYRHTQDFIFKHLYLSNETFKGNQRFYNQIHTRQREGVFDYIDIPRSQEHLSTDIESSTKLPVKNTLEFQWNNTVIKKTPRYYDLAKDRQSLRDDFKYSQYSYFNVSQGYDLTKLQGQDGLTRLHVHMGLNFKKGRLAMNEYYFHQKKKHITGLSYSYKLSHGHFKTSLNYNSISIPTIKFASSELKIKPLNVFSFLVGYHYDMDKKQIISSDYKILYTPSNNCWKLDLHYSHSLLQNQGRVAINFLINYNEKAFNNYSL